MNPYEVLGLKGNETDKEIKDAFKKMSLVHHPDKGGNVSDFINVLNAYKKITTMKSNQEYKQLEQKKAFNKLKKEYGFSASEEEENE